MGKPFFFTPGLWKGCGLLRFQSGGIAYPYSSTWDIMPIQNGKVVCKEKITFSEVDVSYFISIAVFNIGTSTFEIAFDNEEYGYLAGKGTWTQDQITFDLYDSEKIKIYSAFYTVLDEKRYQVAHTLLLKTGNFVILDGHFAAPALETASLE